MIHALKLSDQVACTDFTLDMLERIDASPDFQQVCFLGEAMFHVSGVVKKYNCRVLGSQNPHVTCELERGNHKLNMWTGLMRDESIGPVFFSEKTDLTFVLGHAGAVCTAPVTTSNFPPTRRVVATVLPPCY
jgi:hypothetical protein